MFEIFAGSNWTRPIYVGLQLAVDRLTFGVRILMGIPSKVRDRNENIHFWSNAVFIERER